MTTTYNQIVKTFEDLATAHMQVNTFGSLKTWNFQSQTNIYPAVLLIPVPGNIQQGLVKFSFELYVLDLLNGDRSNLNEVHSDTIQILNDFVAELADNEDTYGFTIDENTVSMEPIEEAFDDIVAGWVANIDVYVPNTLDDCETPFTR